MIAFGSSIADAPSAAAAAEQAAHEARTALRGRRPAIAVVFASASYERLDAVPRAVARALGGDVPVVGGTSGASVIGPHGTLTRGVSVVVLGGEGIEACTTSGVIASADLLEAVPAAARIAKLADDAAARGFTALTCLAFAPGVRVDGAAFTAALRKGAGARAQLAGALTGDDLTFDRARVFSDGAAHADRFVLAGLFTRAPLGVVTRHGWRAVGPKRAITRGDGAWLVALDGRPAIDAWLEDAREAGATPPPGRGRDVALYLAGHYTIGLLNGSDAAAVRVPFEIRDDGAVLLAAGVPERTSRACVMRSEPDQLLHAAQDAARDAATAAGRPIAGALVLAGSGRLLALGDVFPREPAAIARELRAPVGGSCVFGEIARAPREIEAFHGMTVAVVAVPSG